jgi:hypothetical protein
MKKGRGGGGPADGGADNGGGRNPFKGGGKKKAALKASAPTQHDDPEALVPGLVLVKDFITKEEEEQLIQVPPKAHMSPFSSADYFILSTILVRAILYYKI